MSEQQMREAFEAHFVKPEVVTWNGSAYEVREGWENSYRIELFFGRWGAWQVATSQQMDRVRELEEALRQIVAIEDEMFGPDWAEIEKARSIASAALRKEQQ